jgi:hypothetical protein
MSCKYDGTYTLHAYGSPKAFYGPPLRRVFCRDNKIRVPVPDEFAVFVLIKGAKPANFSY